MSNPFDQFDEPAVSGNPFDQFDEPQNPKQNKGFAGDVGAALKHGIQKLPGIATGLIDIPAGMFGLNRPADRLADAAGEATGFQPAKWAQETEKQYSSATQAGREKINQAWDDPNTTAMDVAGAYLANPRTTAINAIESVPAMLAGGVAGKVIGGAAKLASGAARAGIGEGAVMAGSAMDQISPEVDPQKAAAAALATGVAGGAIGYAGGRIANRLGITDIDALTTGGTRVGAQTAMPFYKRIPAGAMQEGLLEEAPQSAVETALQNWSENKPLTLDMARNVTEGALAGGLMGGVGGAMPQNMAEQTVHPPAPGQAPTTPTDQGLPPADTVPPVAPVVEPAAPVGQAPVQPEQVTAQPVAEAQAAAPTVQSTPSAPPVLVQVALPTGEVLTETAAPSLTNAAIVAVNSGATPAAPVIPSAPADEQTIDPVQAEWDAYQAQKQQQQDQAAYDDFFTTAVNAKDENLKRIQAANRLQPTELGAPQVNAVAGPGFGVKDVLQKQPVAPVEQAPIATDGVAKERPYSREQFIALPDDVKQWSRSLADVDVKIKELFDYASINPRTTEKQERQIVDLAKYRDQLLLSGADQSAADHINEFRNNTQTAPTVAPNGAAQQPAQTEQVQGTGVSQPTQVSPTPETAQADAAQLGASPNGNQEKSTSTETTSQVLTPGGSPITAAHNPARPASGFDSKAWNKKRDDTIKESRKSGAVHLDSITPSVESMRGREIYNVHDPKEKGVIRTVDNWGNVYIQWSDDYSGKKNSASETEEPNKSWLKTTKSRPIWKKKDGERTLVLQTSLGTTDLKDYVFGTGEYSPPASLQEGIARVRAEKAAKKQPTESTNDQADKAVTQQAKQPAQADQAAVGKSKPTIEEVARSIQLKVAQNRRKLREKLRKERDAKGYAPNSTPESEQADYEKEISAIPGDLQIASASKLLGSDPEALIQMFVNGNYEASEDIFKEITGVKIRGLNAKDKKAALYQWAKWTPEQIAASEKKSADAASARSEKFKQDDKEHSVSMNWLALDRLKVSDKDGKTKSGKEYILEMVANGFDKVHTQKKGAITLYGLTNGSQFSNLKNKDANAFLKAAIEFGGLDKALEYINKPGMKAPDGFVDRSINTIDSAKKPEQTKAENIKALADKLQGKKAEPVAPQGQAATPAKKETLKDKAERIRSQRADYFTPGNIVKAAYGQGNDRVISYTPPDETGAGWSVTVESVVKQGGKWVVDPNNKRQHQPHATQPSEADLKAGPVERVAVSQPAANVADEPVQAAASAKPKTPAGGITARARAYAANPLIAFIAKNGLYHKKGKPGSLKSEFSPDKNPFIQGYGVIFRMFGKRLDELVAAAIEDGFMPINGDEAQLYALIQRAISGEKISPLYAQGVAEDFAAQSYEEHLKQQQEAAQDEDYDPFSSLDDLGFEIDDAAQAGYDEAQDPIKIEVNAILLVAQDLGIDTETIKLEAHYATEGQSEQAYYEAARDYLKAAIEGSRRDSSKDAGSASNAGVEEDGLTSYTPTEVLAQQAAAEKVAKDEEKSDQESKDKARKERIAKEISARQDASAENFQLGQSAEESLSGQGSIFDAPVQPAKPAAQEPSKPKEAISDVGEKIGGARKDTAVSTGTKTKTAEQEDDRPTWAKRFAISQVAAGFDSSQKKTDISGKWTITDTRKTDWLGNQKQIGGYFDSKEDAESALPLVAISLKHRVTTSRTDSEKFEIWRDVSDSKRVKVVDKEFATRIEAMEYMAKHATEILETSTTFGEADLPKPESTTRVGVSRRTGDVEGKTFIDDFGMRAVEFGNWNNQDERQEVMNAAYDGLMDLADVLGVPPKAIGLNGDLALAFGARGQGLSSARAHYERSRVVMNLTKMYGAGALAHEWFHALDHYLARQDGKAASEWTVNPDGTRSLAAHATAEADMSSSGFKHNSGVREKLRDAYRTLIQTLFTKAEQYVEDTEKADKFVGVSRSELDQKLKELRSDLATQSPYAKRNNKPASAEQLAEFDAIASALVEGRGLATEWKTMPGKNRLQVISRWTNEAMEKIGEIYKAVRGRSGFNAEKTGVVDRLRSYITRYESRLKMLEDAAKSTEKTKQIPTQFAMDAKSLDQGRGSDYWTTPHEMAARAFQGYVEDMIAAKGGKSPFLNYAPENVGLITPWGVKLPYPSGQERKAMNKAFDAFVQTVQTKETDKGVAMFSRGTATKGLPPSQITSIVNAIRSQWANAPEVVVAQNMDDALIPQAVRDYDAKQRSLGATGTPEGFVYGGRVYVVADQLATPTDVMRVMFHESLGHLGLRGVFGKQLDPVLNQIILGRRAEVLAKAEKYGLDAKNRDDLLEAAEEVLAELAQTRPELGLVQRAIAAIRNWLRDHVPGFAAMKLTDADVIQKFILPARAFVERGRGAAGGATAFSRGKNGAMTNTNVVGKQGGRSADDSTPGASTTLPKEMSARGVTMFDGLRTKEGNDIAQAFLKEFNSQPLMTEADDFFGDPAKDRPYYERFSAASYSDAQQMTVAQAIESFRDGESITPKKALFIADLIQLSDAIHDANAKIYSLMPDGFKNSDVAQEDFGSVSQASNFDPKSEYVASPLKSKIPESEISESDPNYSIGRLKEIDAGKPEQYRRRPIPSSEIAERFLKDPTALIRQMVELTGFVRDSNEASYSTFIENYSPEALKKERENEAKRLADYAIANAIFGKKPNESTAPDSGGAIRFSRTHMAGQTTRQHTPEQLQAMRNTGAIIEVPTLKERAKALWQDAGKKMAQGIVDQFAPVKAIDGTAYALLRLSKGASGAFESLLHGGQLKLTDNVYDFDDANRGGVVEKLLKPMQGEHHDFLRWVSANRSERLTAEDRENLFTPDDISALKTLADGDLTFDYTIKNGIRTGRTTRVRSEMYRDSLVTFNQFNKNVLDMAEQSGLIDGDSRQFWEHEFYVPFYRVASDDDGGVRGMNIKSGVIRQQAFKTLKGGKNKLNHDLLDNTLMNWAHLLDASAKNRAAKATIEAAETAGIALYGNQYTLAQMGASINNKNGVVWFMDEGKKRYSLIDNQGGGAYLMTAITALEYAGMRNPVMNAMSAMKHMLTIGVTASPFFKIRNLIRDSVSVIGLSGINANPIANVAQGWKLTDPKSDAYFRLMAGGGTIHFGTMLEGNEGKRMQALIESGVDASTILGDDHKVKAFYRKYIEPGVTAYNELGNRGEAVNRASLYDQLVRQGKTHAEASLQARDLMDFSMQGSFTSIRFLSQVVPFFNARLQGMYKLGRSAADDPKRLGMVLGATALFSLALLAAYSDDDDWKRREDWDRSNYWWFKFGGTAFRIPKPFEIGAIATLAERGFELAFDNEMTGTAFRKQVLALLKDNLSMNPIPQIVKPILDVYANKDSFSGRPIENMSMERLKSEYRFNGGTSMTARGLSTAANSVTGLVGVSSPSPVQIDHMLRGYFGWLGSFVVGTADLLARPATGQAERATPDYWKMATGSMVSDLRDAPSKYVSNMYDQAKVIEEAYGTWRALQKQGDIEGARDFREENIDKIKKYRQVEAVKRTESKLNERIRMIERSDKDSDEKRTLIRAIQQRKEQVAKRVVPL